jgi:cytochrome b subunit of formate dehydrogenase
VVVVAGTTTRTRYSRAGRWYHCLVYVVSFVLLATGWWLLLGREGEPSLMARMLSRADTSIHTTAGWGLAGLGLLAMFASRAAWSFVRDSLRFSRSDPAWLARWPAAAFTGRFGHHPGRFDPGQRIANLVMVVGLALVTLSGVGLVLVSGGPAFVWLVRVHKWATYVLTPVIAGHVIVASGLLPGYRGVWRSMHLGGRVNDEVVRRLWPDWAEEGKPGS